MDDLFGIGKLSTNSMDLIKMVYPDLAQPSLQKVGTALGTVFELSNTILLPIKMANEKGSLLFKRHMEKYEENLNNVSIEEITQVPPSLGLKVMEELFTVTNDEIAKLFIKLLTQGSTASGVKYAHPGFVEVIKNLSEDEAKIINEVYAEGKNVKYSYLVKLEDGVIPIGKRVSNLRNLVTMTFTDNSLFYLENLLKLGIIKDSQVIMNSEMSEHLLVAKQLETEQKKVTDMLKEEQDKGKLLNVEIGTHHGRYILSSYGEQFIQSIKP